MTTRKILSVGADIPGADADDFISVDSDRSLLDADIVLFQPGIPDTYRDSSERPYQGKPTLSKPGSLRAVEHARHWRSELQTAAEAGKTVIVFLAQPQEAYVYTG